MIFCRLSLLNHIDLFLIRSQKVLIYLQSDLPSEKVLSALLTWELPSWDKQGRILINVDSSAGKESACNAGDPGSIPGSGGSAGEGIGSPLQYSWASLVAQLVKTLPAMRETWVQSLGWEDQLEKGTLPSPVFWPGEFHGLYSPWGCKESDMTEHLSLSLSWV